MTTLLVAYAMRRFSKLMTLAGIALIVLALLIAASRKEAPPEAPIQKQVIPRGELL